MIFKTGQENQRYFYIAFIYRHFTFADFSKLFRMTLLLSHICTYVYFIMIKAIIYQNKNVNTTPFEYHCSNRCHNLFIMSYEQFLHIEQFYAISNDISIPLQSALTHISILCIWDKRIKFHISNG